MFLIHKFKLWKGLEDKRSNHFERVFRKGFPQAHSFPTQERLETVRMMFLLSLESFWSVGIMISTPLVFIMMELIHIDKDHISSFAVYPSDFLVFC